jgi:hypothetical protein
MEALIIDIPAVADKVGYPASSKSLLVILVLLSAMEAGSLVPLVVKRSRELSLESSVSHLLNGPNGLRYGQMKLGWFRRTLMLGGQLGHVSLQGMIGTFRPASFTM